MRRGWRVAVLDSGLAEGAARVRSWAQSQAVAACSQAHVVASCRFVDTGGEIRLAPAVSDPMGHGTNVAAVICGASQPIELLIGQVLDHRGVTTAAALAAAIAWSLEEGANLIHMSLGLREDRAVLAAVVADAVKAGCVVVASTPVRGAPTFPSRYPQVVRATGDARCQRDEISALNCAQADFGGCPRYAARHDDASPGSASPGSASPGSVSLDGANPVGANPDGARLGGASLGAAHLTRFLVDRVAPGTDLTAVRAELCSLARYHGIERRAAVAHLPAN